MALSIVVVWLVRRMARETAGLGLLEVKAARTVAESVAHRHRPCVVEVAPAQRADLAACMPVVSASSMDMLFIDFCAVLIEPKHVVPAEAEGRPLAGRRRVAHLFLFCPGVGSRRPRQWPSCGARRDPGLPGPGPKDLPGLARPTLPDARGAPPASSRPGAHATPHGPSRGGGPRRRSGLSGRLSQPVPPTRNPEGPKMNKLR